MYLLVNPNGSKYFRYNYRFNGKRKTLALGIYPVTSLKEAREKRDTAKKKIDGGIDPSMTRKTEKAGSTENTFSALLSLKNLWRPTGNGGARATMHTLSNALSVMYSRGWVTGR